MPNIILQPASGPEALKHYEKTIVTGVTFKDIARFISEKQQNDLRVIYRDSPLQIWGIVPGEKNINLTKWLKIGSGDIVFFSQSGYLVGKGIITYKIPNKQLALELWGLDPDGQTWEYTYFLNDFERIKIPVKKFNNLIGYKENFPIYGVMVLDIARSEEVISHFGSVDNFLKELGIEEKLIVEEEDIINTGLLQYVHSKDFDTVINKIESEIRDRPLAVVKRIGKYIIRNSSLSKALKQKYDYKCQLCGVDGFKKRSGEPYSEVHHVIGLCKGGTDLSHNLLVVCANCHRKLEYAKIEFDDSSGLIRINDKEFKIIYK